MLNNIKVGDKFVGEINDEIIEITDIKKENNGVIYVHIKDKTGNIFHINYDTFIRLQIKKNINSFI